MAQFKIGDRVRMKVDGVYCYGEVTIPTVNTCKVLFRSADDPDYDYYSNSQLELVTEEDTKEIV